MVTSDKMCLFTFIQNHHLFLTLNTLLLLPKPKQLELELV